MLPRAAPSVGEQFLLGYQEIANRSPPQLRKSQETVVYQHNAISVFSDEDTIFGLTHMLETASCRPYCLNDWRL
jgi:hypothetical protein